MEGESTPLPCCPFSSDPNTPPRSQVGLSPKKALGRGEGLEGSPERASPNPLAALWGMVGRGDLRRQKRPDMRAPRKNRDALAHGR